MLGHDAQRRFTLVILVGEHSGAKGARRQQ
jgi:hypothetical protein